MRVLITNNTLAVRAGSELYVRDLAIELMRRGHHPVAYSTILGPVAEELRAATVPVIDRLNSLGAPPDIIHGHHHYETLTALLRFPTTPAVYYCHGWLPWQEAALKHPNILRYVAVDEVCRERLIAEGGIQPDRIDLVLNFFDERLFPPRPPLPRTPRRALAFGNEFAGHSGLPILIEACARYGIEVDAQGFNNGNSTAQPGRRLAAYDIVFAKARSAIEALAVGAAVVLCTPGKLGPMVTTENFAALRQLNFGIRTLSQPMDVDSIAAELRKYDFEDAAKVSQLARTVCEMGPAVDRIVDLYQRVLADASRSQSVDHSRAAVHAAQYLEDWGARYKGADQETLRNRQLLRQRDAEVARLVQELAAVRSSATWRWTQNVLQSAPVQLLFGGVIRSVAGRGRHPGTPPVAAAPSLADAAPSRNLSTPPFSHSGPLNPDSSNVQLRAERMISAHGFLGVPGETFSRAGREQLIALLREGMHTESKVVEFGCGCLRIAYWLVRFLDARGYHGIEPARQRVDYGLRYLFRPEEIQFKQPRFDFNPNFNSSVFGEKFDFFVARSIWTHASKSQVEATLDSFLRDAAAAAIFLASYLPARSPEEDYLGSEWVGTSDESDTPGVIRHDLQWIIEQCRKRHLSCEEIPGVDCDGQLWLRIRSR